MKKRTSYLILIAIIALCIVIDLVTKVVFADVLSSGDIIVIPNLFTLTYVENTGAAYGMLGGKTWLLIVISIVFLVAFVLYDIFNHSTNGWYLAGVGMIVGGAIGNFVDRIFLGYVRDFLSIRFFNFVFNMADMFITFGIICFAIYIVIGLVKDAKEKKGKDKDATEDK